LVHFTEGLVPLAVVFGVSAPALDGSRSKVIAPFVGVVHVSLTVPVTSTVGCNVAPIATPPSAITNTIIATTNRFFFTISPFSSSFPVPELAPDRFCFYKPIVHDIITGRKKPSYRHAVWNGNKKTGIAKSKLSFGNPAVFGRPAAFRPSLSGGIGFIEILRHILMVDFVIVKLIITPATAIQTLIKV
jgi:hypothetical protein